MEEYLRILLDQIHRPAAAWGMLLLMGVISILVVLVQMAVAMTTDITTGGLGYMIRSLFPVLVGFAAMLAVYRLDYSGGMLYPDRSDSQHLPV